MEKINKELQTGGLILFVLFTIANGTNYLYQIVMGRMLSIEDFGTLNSLLSLFMMTAVPAGAITSLVAKYLIEYKSAGRTELYGVFVFRAMKVALLGFALISILGVAVSPLVAQYLNINSLPLVSIVMVMIGLNVLVSVTTGAIQGLKQFLALGLIGVILPVLKLVFGFVLIWLGFRLFGALSAIVLAIAVTFLIGIYYIRRRVSVRDRGEVKLENASYVRFFLSAFSLSAFMAVLMNMDMLVVKHYLPQSTAGLYSPAMVLSHAILYAPSALVQVMFPLVVEANVKAPLSGYKLFVKVLLINAGIITACVIGLWLTSGVVILLLFGEKYMSSASYILPACLFVMPIAFLTVLLNFSIAVDNTKFLTLTMAAGCVLNLVLIQFFHSDIYQILSVMTVVGVTIVLVNILALGLKYRGLSLREMQRQT